jgi:MFS family permease
MNEIEPHTLEQHTCSSDMLSALENLERMFHAYRFCMNGHAANAVLFGLAIEAQMLAIKMKAMLGRWNKYLPFHEVMDVKFDHWQTQVSEWIEVLGMNSSEELNKKYLWLEGCKEYMLDLYAQTMVYDEDENLIPRAPEFYEVDIKDDYQREMAAYMENMDELLKECSAVFYTHYHGDHLGFAAEVHKRGVPQYMGPLAIRMMLHLNRHMTFAESLTPKERKRAAVMAIGSTLFGCISEVMLDSTAVVTLYFFALDGSAAMTVFAAGFSSLSGMLFLILSANLTVRIGLKRLVKYACLFGMTGLVLAAAAPYFGASGKYIALVGCLMYCFQRPFYGAAWYPLLDNFLRPQDRGSFFGVLRFLYMLAIGIPFFLLGIFMGKEAPVVWLQVIIACAGIALLGRWLFIEQLPVDPAALRESADIRKALGGALRNGPLTGYSVYVCFFTIAYSPIYPLILAYLKEYIKLTAGEVQLISSIWIGGQVIPFLCYGKLLKTFGLKKLELTVHLTVFMVAFALFIIPAGTGNFFWIASALVLLLSMAQSCYMCNNSAEIMALARPGNKSMATAFSQTYQAIGGAVGRNLSSALLGFGLLSPMWSLGGMEFSNYQTLFLLCAIIALVIFCMLPIMPSVVPKHDDYYMP